MNDAKDQNEHIPMYFALTFALKYIQQQYSVERKPKHVKEVIG